MNIYGYYPKVGSKCAHKIGAIVAHIKPETGQVVIFLINQAIEMNGLDHHLFSPMDHMNCVMINEVPKLLAPIPGEIMHAIQIINPFGTTQPIIFIKLHEYTSYFN